MKNIDGYVRKLMDDLSIEPQLYIQEIEYLDEKLKSAQEHNNETESNQLWRLKSALEVKLNYLDIFRLIKEQNYLEAWRQLEICEIKLKWMKENSSSKFQNQYSFPFYKNHVEYWQSLFPYNLFASPAFTASYTCSICGSKIKPRSRCQHKKGKLYTGELCYYIVDEINPIEISLVERPAQKYSVLLSPEIEYDYGRIKFVADRLDHPLEKWKPIKTVKTYSREVFDSVPESAFCPCTKHQKTFLECCFHKKEISIPHITIKFDKYLSEEQTKGILFLPSA